MHLTFLGTSAGTPSLQRNVTAIGLTLSHRGDCWLFDCGEATQHQFMRSMLKPGRLQRIFITHLHGDHIFGLPGLLTSRSMGSISEPLTLYGPPGLRAFVETTLSLSGSFVTYPLEVIEIEAGVIFDDGVMKVTAYPLNHVMPCFGFRIEQYDRLGYLNSEKLKADNVPRGPWLQQLKQGKSVTLEDGRTIHGRDYLGPSTPGKKLAIFGDTAPAECGLALAAEVDVMVHEATLESALEEKANMRGHSTTVQTATLARDARARHLIATHFSSRYRFEDMPRLLAECQAIFPATELARDLAVFEI
ncbi:Ribonuclease BN [Mixta theicola]|nr:ribonuclease Z [Mixta theicola]QHM77305.1 Ribonuclease BN [Mixta theicola]